VTSRAGLPVAGRKICDRSKLSSSKTLPELYNRKEAVPASDEGDCCCKLFRASDVAQDVISLG